MMEEDDRPITKPIRYLIALLSLTVINAMALIAVLLCVVEFTRMMVMRPYTPLVSMDFLLALLLVNFAIKIVVGVLILSAIARGKPFSYPIYHIEWLNLVETVRHVNMAIDGIKKIHFK